jgi:hypothetical protein
MKIKYYLIIMILLTSSILKSQTKTQIHFIGFSLYEYVQPVLISTDTYQAYFENMGESMEQGRIIIEEEAKMFTIKWLDGEDWVAKFTKKEIKAEHDDWFGDVTRTTYVGKWIDENIDCLLLLTETKSSGCITTLKSKKVIDTDYGIDTWKKSYTFGTGGKCFE